MYRLAPSRRLDGGVNDRIERTGHIHHINRRENGPDGADQPIDQTAVVRGSAHVDHQHSIARSGDRRPFWKNSRVVRCQGM